MGSGNIMWCFYYSLGAFGEVRMCQHRKMRAVRAVKILKKAALKQEEIERFIHEIEIL